MTDTTPHRDFRRIIQPARVPCYRIGSLGREMPSTTRLFVTIEYQGGRLSITGVEGPLSNGDALGSCGQCGVHAEAEPVEPFTQADLARLREIWDAWHLNDMRPYSPEMKALGWHDMAATPMLGHRFTMTLESIKAGNAAKDAALSAARAGQTFTPTAAQVEALARPYEVTIWRHLDAPAPDAPDGMEPARHIGGHNSGAVMSPERKTLGWLRPSEHPAGLLGRKVNESDPHGYGGKWWREDVPRDVLEWLAALPDAAAAMPATWRR